MADLAGTPVSAEVEYKSRVDDLARDFLRFRPLQSFLNLQETSPSTIRRVHLHGSNGSAEVKIETVQENDLRKFIDDGSCQQVLVVEKLSPRTVTVLGSHLRVDPEFFLDYIDAIPEEFVITEESKSRMSEQGAKKRDFIPKPWYRLEKVDGHLPMLSSLRSNNNHINIRYIGPREYEDSPNKKPPERMQPDLLKMNVARIAGLHFPIKHDTGGMDSFNNVAMTRHTAAIWFKPPNNLSKPEWTTGIILLDPPFEVRVSQENSENPYGKRNQSVYRPFSVLSQPEGKILNINRGTTYMESLVWCMSQNPRLKGKGAWHPFCIIEDVSRIIASEWIAVGTYIERDLNSIEWQLESSKVRIEILETLLTQLLILRRRLGKFTTLVQDELQILQGQAPRAWVSTGTLPINAAECLAGMQDDLKQAHALLEKNSVRVSQAMELITTIIQLRDGEYSTTQNERLGFLTIIATTALPFSTVASILGMQTKYGPPGGQNDGDGSWIEFWKVSGIVLGAVWGVYVLYWMLSRLYKKVRVGKH